MAVFIQATLIMIAVMKVNCIQIKPVDPHQDYEIWHPGTNETTGFLYCHASCSNLTLANYISGLSSETHGKCCDHNHLSFYDVKNSLYRDIIRNLSVEYITHYDGKALVLPDPSLEKNTTDYLFVCSHGGGYLSGIPENICEFNTTVTLLLPNNRIRDFGKIVCLNLLSELDLSHNEITYINNTTFSNMPFLWKVDFSYNEIETIDPFTLTSSSLSLLEMKFSNNLITEIDISNVFLDRVIRYLDYSNNSCIKKFVNLGQFSFKTLEDKSHSWYERGGFVDFRNSLCLKEFPDLLKIANIEDDPTFLGKVFLYSFHFGEFVWPCNSAIYSLMNTVKEICKLGKEFIPIKCRDPFNNTLTVCEAILWNDTSIFKTNLTYECPSRRCLCYHQADINSTIVNCTSRRLQRFPDISKLSNFKNISLFLDNNIITDINITKWDGIDVFYIDLSNNPIISVPESFFHMFRNTNHIYLRNSTLKSVSKSVMNMIDVCAFDFTSILSPCTCEDSWLSTWMKRRKPLVCKDKGTIICRNSKKSILSSESQEIFQNCNEDFTKYAFFSMVLFLVPLWLLYSAFEYRVELFLIKRKLLSRRNRNSDVTSSFYDIYISSPDSDPDLRRWLCETFVSYFEDQNYRVFWPYRDFLVGEIMADQISELTPRCKNFIVFLSRSEEHGYFSCEKQTIEWKYIWNHYKMSKNKEILPVNLHNIRACECHERIILAFLRLGYTLSFDNQNHRLLQHIKDRIGASTSTLNGFQTSKPKFDCSTINPKN